MLKTGRAFQHMKTAQNKVSGFSSVESKLSSSKLLADELIIGSDRVMCSIIWKMFWGLVLLLTFWICHSVIMPMYYEFKAKCLTDLGSKGIEKRLD